MKKHHIVLLLGLLLIILFSSRMLWIDSFRYQKHEPIKDAQFDLRDWNAEDGDILLLDGEWEFYPSQWLIENGQLQDLDQSGPTLIELPGKWDEALHTEESTPYGFGSYRLRLYVDPEDDFNYSIRIQSIHSSSEIYVNGKLLAKSGQVAESAEDHIAKNLPYSTSFTADENGVIDLVIQVANFEDSRSGGLVRSIKFGSEEAIATETKFSISMQLLTTIVLLVHAVYALILYVLGDRNKKLLYFSLLIFSIILTTTLSNDEKLFHQLFYIGNVWDFRLANAAIMMIAYALLECTNHRKLPFWGKIYPIYTIMVLGTIGITLLSDPHQVIMLFPVYYLLFGISVVITAITIFKKITKDIKGNFLLLISLIALVHHLLWMQIWRGYGLSLIHYPFDFIISISCLAAVWFKDYFNMHANTKELAARLQRMNDHKDQFLANTSHEFKNPLHSILNMSQSVLKREKHLLQERSIKELETVLSVGQRLTLLLNDLIDVMSLREGNPRLLKKTIFIQPIVTGVLDMLQFNVEVKSVKIVNQIPENFPPVVADENRVIQIIFNLLHNAVKYTNEGVISIHAFEKDNRAFIVISDTGIGMDEDMLKRIFMPHEQVSSNMGMIEGGFGLGLSISKQLVELHGGTLDVSSVLGEGSKFTFSLKLADLKAEEKNEVSNSFEQFVQHAVPSLEKVSIDLEKAKISEVMKETPFIDMNRAHPLILVVDDDPVNLQVLEAILPSDQYELTMVTSGKEALALLDKKQWDLVISDIMMPQMSGYELTRMIRRRFQFTELPILLLTARSQPQDIQSGFLAGANDYVTKPVEAMEFRSRIEALITIKQSVQEQLRLETAWLQAQIQPHFIFNVLNSVIALSEIDLDRMRELLNEFSDFLRYKFQFQNMDELIPIQDELNLVRSYLYIEKVRFGEMIQVDWKIDNCKELKIPFLTIQPLVENAMKHGILKRIRGGKIFICVSVYETYVEISVEDDGVGMNENQMQQLLERKTNRKSGVGFINTDQRLKRHFGTGLHIKSALGTGTKVSFKIPNEINNENFEQ